jgi:hypothetical protein
MASETRSGWQRCGALAVMAAAVATSMVSVPVRAADPCDGFSWNVAHERALFATPAAAVTAASAAGPAPTLAVDKLYDITLTPQDKVSFVLAPAKKALADGAFAGMVTLHIPSAGKYRVAMSEGFWIDVIADGKFAPTDDFTGAHDCRAPRKIVQYPLPAGDLTLQFSNTNSASVRVTVTAAPP